MVSKCGRCATFYSLTSKFNQSTIIGIIYHLFIKVINDTVDYLYDLQLFHLFKYSLEFITLSTTLHCALVILNKYIYFYQFYLSETVYSEQIISNIEFPMESIKYNISHTFIFQPLTNCHCSLIFQSLSICYCSFRNSMYNSALIRKYTLLKEHILFGLDNDYVGKIACLTIVI